MNKYILSYVLLTFPVFLFAQKYTLTRHFTTEDGLADIVCRGGFMDSKGYVWISTSNGLSRYDGHRFKNYFHNPDDPASLCWNLTTGFYEDEDGYLWVGTDNGLARFDYATERWKCYTSIQEDSTTISGNKVYDIHKEDDKAVWINMHSAGLNLFDTEEEIFKRYALKEGLTSARSNWLQNTVSDMIQDISDKNILWIIAEGGLFKFDKESGKFSRESRQKSGRAIYMDKPGEIYAGFWGYGLGKYDINADKWTFFYPVPVKKPSGLQNIIKAIRQIKKNNWTLAFLQ